MIIEINLYKLVSSFVVKLHVLIAYSINMNLREPKKKRRVKLKEQSPFPVVLDEKNDWITYTAHLTELGSCIIEPSEIAAVHSMVMMTK